MRLFLLTAIHIYRRYLSQYKGFCCSYHAHTGHPSCSALGYRVIRRYGPLTGLALLRRRLYLCGVAFRRYGKHYQRPFRSQRGDCDLGCDLPCDLSGDSASGKSCSSVGDYANCCDAGSCDGPDRKKKQEHTDKKVYIPPQVNS